MAARKRKVTKKKPARAAAKKKATKKKTKQTAPKKRRAKAPRQVVKVDPDATIQVPVAEVLGDIEETMALDRLREER